MRRNPSERFLRTRQIRAASVALCSSEPRPPRKPPPLTLLLLLLLPLPQLPPLLPSLAPPLSAAPASSRKRDRRPRLEAASLPAASRTT